MAAKAKSKTKSLQFLARGGNWGLCGGGWGSVYLSKDWKMKKQNIIGLIVVMFGLILSGCSDAQVASFGAMGSQGHIRCFSGTLQIYDGWSTGKIATVSQSDGWEFKDAKTSKFVRVSGSCVIEN